MRAVFIYSNFDFSKRSAGATRMFYYAQILANKNTNVYLVSCSTSNIATNSFKEIYPNIFILENPNLTQSLIGTLKYIVNLYKFSKKASTYSAFIFYPSPLVYLEIIAIVYLKLIKGCRIFYEFNEVRKYTSAFYEKVSFKKPVYSVKKLIYKSVFSFMEVFLPFYNGLICISTSMVNYGKKFNQNLIRIPILTNPDLEIQYSNVIYNNPNSFNIGFSGTIHPEKENLIEFFEVLSRLKEKKYNFTLNLCGFIDKKHIRSLLEEKAGELKIKN